MILRLPVLDASWLPGGTSFAAMSWTTAVLGAVLACRLRSRAQRDRGKRLGALATAAVVFSFAAYLWAGMFVLAVIHDWVVILFLTLAALAIFWAAGTVSLLFLLVVHALFEGICRGPRLPSS
jgi:MFS family permease